MHADFKTPIALQTSLRSLWGMLCAVLAASVLSLGGSPALAANEETQSFDQDSIIKDATEFFGQTTEGLAKVIEKAFKENGRPNAYIKGEEIGGAITVGLRYGNGMLMMKGEAPQKVFWQGPSVGFDLGANASKVFILVYHLPSSADLFRRYPAVDGSVYYVAGAGINYQRRDNVVLAPIRLGAGWRAGASIGYMHYTKEKTLNPL